MDHWRRKVRGYWRLAADCAVKMLVEADIDQVQWAMGLRAGNLFERVLVEMGASVGGLVGVTCVG